MHLHAVNKMIRICDCETIRREKTYAFDLYRSDRTTPRLHAKKGVLVIDEQGNLQAFVNECKHLPIPLDAGTHAFLDKTSKYLMCKTHGALFRRGDGKCIQGPCKGKYLARIHIKKQGDDIFFISR